MGRLKGQKGLVGNVVLVTTTGANGIMVLGKNWEHLSVYIHINIYIYIYIFIYLFV